MMIKTNNELGWMHGDDGDGIVLNFVDRARGVVRHKQSPTIQTRGGETSGVIVTNRIRKLTEVECMRLMGFDDCEIHRLMSAKQENGRHLFSRTLLYKFAGNSVVVDCYKAIALEILKDIERGDEPRKDTLDAWF